MRTVPKPDLQAVNSLILRFYDAALHPDLWPGVLDEMAAMCGGLGVTVFPMEAAGPSFTYISDSIAEAAGAYFSDWISRCPRIDYDARNPIRDRCLWDGDIMDEETIRKNAYFNDYSRTFDVKFSAIRTTSEIGPESRHVISTPFSLKTGAPSPESLQIFEILSGHAAKAMAVYQRLSLSQDAVESMASQLGNTSCGVVLLNSMGTVTFMNPVAAAMAGDGFTVAGKRLVATAPVQQGVIDRLLARAFDPSLDAGPPDIRTLSRSAGKKPLVINAIPLSGKTDRPYRALLGTDRGIAVMIFDPQTKPDATGQSVFLTLGLTEAEARVAAILGTGVSPEAVAESRSLSTGTIRNHMKSIFIKLGISRQSELVALAGRLKVLANRVGG